MPFLGDCAVRHMGAVLDAFEDELFPALDTQADAHAGGAGGRAALDHEHQFDPWRPDRRFPARPALAQRAGFLPAHHRPALPARRRHRRGEGRGDDDPRPAEARAPEIRLRDPRRHGGAAADDRARRAGGRSGGATASARCSTASRTMSFRPAPTTRSTSPASAICTTASPTARAFSISPTGPTSGSALPTWSNRPR